MDAPRDFAGKDLRNRSFRGQDLRGADFSDSDLRGCDFREANLIGASFERANMGQSNQQIIVCLVFIFIGISVGCLTVIHSVILNGNLRINLSGDFFIDSTFILYRTLILFVVLPTANGLSIIIPIIQPLPQLLGTITTFGKPVFQAL